MLGSVCKKLNELIKNEGWYREIKLSSWIPTVTVGAAVAEVITRNAAHLQTIRFNKETKERLFYAMQKCDNAIEEISFEEDETADIEWYIKATLKELHSRSNELYLCSLAKLNFNNTFEKMEWTLNKGTGTEHFSSRIHTLAVTFCVTKYVPMRWLVDLNKYEANLMKLTTLAMREIPSLSQVTVGVLSTSKLEGYRDKNMEEDIKHFKASMIAFNLYQPLEKIGWNVERCNIKHSEGLLEFVLKRDEPELQFKKFLYGPS